MFRSKEASVPLLRFLYILIPRQEVLPILGVATGLGAIFFIQLILLENAFGDPVVV